LIKTTRKVKKAVITAAGYGTRFLPATKNIPKELLPIVNKPMIGYVVDSCIEAGIEEIIIVTRFGNHSVEDYFDSSPALEEYLLRKNKQEKAREIKEVYKKANFIFVRQNPDLPYGNASPLFSAKELISDEPFIYAYGDDFTLGDKVGAFELVKVYEKQGADCVLNCIKTTKEKVSKTGAAVVIKEGTKNEVIDIVEKPPINNVPSNILSVSPYLLTPKIFDYLDPKKDNRTGEFLIQKAIEKMIKGDGLVRASITKGKWVTNGDPLNYLITTVEIALTREDINGEFIKFLKERIKEYESKK
jgi:UTP--glucose-1-phosphate uridylyltransferase